MEAEANVSAISLIGDLATGEQTWEIVDAQSRFLPGSVYLYHLTYTSPYMPTAVHGSDVPFVFGNLIPKFANADGAPADDNDRLFSDIVMTYWTNFAKFGDPNGVGGGSIPQWSVDGSVQADVLELGTRIGPLVDD
jgi:para-nitrobenzyl esterase